MLGELDVTPVRATLLGRRGVHLGDAVTLHLVLLAASLRERRKGCEPLHEGVVLVHLRHLRLGLLAVCLQLLLAESRVLAGAQRGLRPRQVQVVAHRPADREIGGRLPGSGVVVPLGAFGAPPPVAAQALIRIDDDRCLAFVVAVAPADPAVAGGGVGIGAHEHLSDGSTAQDQMPTALPPGLVPLLIAVVVTLEVLVVAELALEDGELAELCCLGQGPPREVAVLGGFAQQVFVADFRTSLTTRRDGRNERLVGVVLDVSEDLAAVRFGQGVVGGVHLAVQAQAAFNLSVAVCPGGALALFGAARLTLAVQQLRQTTCGHTAPQCFL